MVTFDKNVPIPPRGRANSVRGILQSMEVLDSYLFEGKKINSIVAIIATIKWDNKYTARTVEWGVRVWRIS